MSGICGIIALDGSQPTFAQLFAMTELLERRGPDGTHHWLSDSVALGHTLLATTPEALVEVLPLTDHETGCTITADVRLDNREELLPELGLANESRIIGDGELILHSYLKWGEECLDHFLGDFAFAIWDPRTKKLFCGRDHFGMRQLSYCHVPGRAFVFATEPRAVSTHKATPRSINEGRIVDFLLDFEGINFTSTFFEDVYRLPPAHKLALTSDGLRTQRYWTLTPGPSLSFSSDEEYAVQFLKVFTEAVRCRLRGAGRVASMLSGGMDSGAIVAVASQLMASEGKEKLTTLSAVGPNTENCIETSTIHAALGMPGLEPHLINYANLEGLACELRQLAEASEEPFDGSMTLVRALYIKARDLGVKVVLDGAGGDLVLNEGSQVARLLRRGQWREARDAAKSLEQFFGIENFRIKILLASAWRAFVPATVRGWWRACRLHSGLLYRKRISIISPDFAKKTDLSSRISEFERTFPYRAQSLPEERANALTHPNLAVARERYDRVAGSLGIEPRDPFLDLRVVNFALSLPGEQLLGDGWPKIIVRRALRHKLPDTVRWRRGKQHLGWAFTEALFETWPGWRDRFHDGPLMLKNWLRPSSWAILGSEPIDPVDKEDQIELFYLRNWLYRL